MNVSLTPKLEAFVREQVDSGLYNNASEVIREGLRMLEARQRQLEWLRNEIREGIAEIERGEVVTVDDAYFERIRERISTRAKSIAGEVASPASVHD